MGARWEGTCPSCGSPGQFHHAWCLEQACATPRAESLSIAQGIIACLVTWALAIMVIGVLTLVAAYHPGADWLWVVSLVFLGAFLIAGWVQ